MSEKLSKTELKIALRALRDIQADRRRWEESCEEDSRNGYRAHYCEHGMNMWTDYDPICGPCEEGWTGPLFDRHRAIERAREYSREFTVILDTYRNLARIHLGETFDFTRAFKTLESRYGMEILDH